VRCPGKKEGDYFLSPKANEETPIRATKAAESSGPSDPAALAEQKLQLQRLVQQGVQLRTQARLDDAVTALRQATQLDPQNSDLHRELGITFLMAKEWKRARVEMLEALRYDQSDADAHNGLGYALEKLGDIDGAVKEYRLATHLDPDDPSYRTRYLDALVKVQTRRQPQK
jgi:Flp pilus assembly protein TadD